MANEMQVQRAMAHVEMKINKENKRGKAETTREIGNNRCRSITRHKRFCNGILGSDASAFHAGGHVNALGAQAFVAVRIDGIDQAFGVLDAMQHHVLLHARSRRLL